VTLSYVGDPFDYDIFVSYARAEAETKAADLCLWSQHIAGRLRIHLATALNAGDSNSDVKVFLDNRDLRSGAPPTEDLREKACRSALLLVLMSLEELVPRRA
jgi:hypothetical protein